MGFVSTKRLGAEDVRPGEIGMGGHVSEELGVAVRKGADDEALAFQSQESRGRVRPAFEVVPYS